MRRGVPAHAAASASFDSVGAVSPQLSATYPRVGGGAALDRDAKINIRRVILPEVC